MNTADTISKHIDGTSDRITATVISAPLSSDDSPYGQCTVRVAKSENKSLKKGSKLLLMGENVMSLEIGDVINQSVTYNTFKDDNKFGYYGDGVYYAAFCNGKVNFIGTSKGLYGLAGKVRVYVKNCLKNNCDNYNILLCIVTGERCYISDELYDRVITAGVSHVLVVSGMHLALICIGLDRFLRLFLKNGFIRDLVILAVAFGISAICGFGVSILRAMLVYVIRAVYRLLYRRATPLHCLALATVTVLTIHPYAFHSIAFQLSYSATFGILVLSEHISDIFARFKYRGKVFKYIIEAVSISLSAYIATLPTCIYAFGVLSVLSVPVNLLIGIPANMMLTFSIIGLVTGFLPFLQSAVLGIADIFADYFLGVVNLASSMPFASLKLKYTEFLTATILICYFIIYLVKSRPYFFKR
jgi:competence protein ComEC